MYEHDDCCMSVSEFIDWLDSRSELDVVTDLDPDFVAVMLHNHTYTMSVTVWKLLVNNFDS